MCLWPVTSLGFIICIHQSVSVLAFDEQLRNETFTLITAAKCPLKQKQTVNGLFCHSFICSILMRIINNIAINHRCIKLVHHQQSHFRFELHIKFHVVSILKMQSFHIQRRAWVEWFEFSNLKTGASDFSCCCGVSPGRKIMCFVWFSKTVYLFLAMWFVL